MTAADVHHAGARQPPRQWHGESKHRHGPDQRHLTALPQGEAHEALLAVHAAAAIEKAREILQTRWTPARHPAGRLRDLAALHARGPELGQDDLAVIDEAVEGDASDGV
jgi:hypothetical protein